MRQELGGQTGTARRLEIATRGKVSADGSLELELGRIRLETRDASGRVEDADTDVVAAQPAERSAEMRTLTRFLGALRGSRATVRLHPTTGITAVEGLDDAMARAAGREEAFHEPRAGLRLLVSDASWLRDLAAAGLCDVPSAVRERGAAERVVRVRIPGRGVTAMRLSGTVGSDSSGLRALQLTGSLSANSEFDGDAGAGPPDEVGEVVLSGVTGSATTSYPNEPGPPVQGEWTLTTPFGGGLVLTTTTSFKLVLR